MPWSLQRRLAWFLLLQLVCGAQKRILAIRAANSLVDWKLVESFARQSWSVDDLELPNFGPIMKEKGFQTALEESEELILSRMKSKPDALLFLSKGVGIASYLVFKDLWHGPLILLSPIPNECGHIQGGSWEADWNSSMHFLAPLPVAVGTGNSHDEQDFIVKSIEETEVCGKMRILDLNHPRNP